MSTVTGHQGFLDFLLRLWGIRPVIVVHRETGERIQEKTPPDIIFQLAVLHTTWLGALIVRSPVLRNYLEHLTVAKGHKYDKPASREQIADFIAAYDIPLESIPKPIEEYRTMNEFFSRVHKPCDCRLMVFRDVALSQRLWIKGRRFTLPKLLGPVYSARWEGCSIALSRLAPGDYHHYHAPCRGRLAQATLVPGGRYSVKPIVVTSGLDVLSENRRIVLRLEDTPCGSILMVLVGAAEVGSIRLKHNVGTRVQKGEELGCFLYGGSSVLTLFPEGAIRFDDDLAERCWEKEETLVQMGSSLGRVNVL